MRDGNYPHCESCSKFVTCSNMLMYERDCPSDLEWDANARRCETVPSPTCTGKCEWVEKTWHCDWAPSPTCNGKCEWVDNTWHCDWVLSPTCTGKCEWEDITSGIVIERLLQRVQVSVNEKV